MSFDSAAKEEEGEGDDRIKQMLGPVVKGLLNQQIVAKINPTGEVTEVILPEAIKKAFAAGKEGGEGDGQRRGGRRGGGMMGMLFGGSLDEEGLKRMVAEGVALLPAEAVKEGTTWKKQILAKMGPATMTTDVEYSYAGTEDRNGKMLDKIAMSSNTTIELPEDADVDAEFEISEQDDKGTIYFDPAAGRTIEATRKVKMTIEGETEMGDVYIERETNSIVMLGSSDDLPEATSDDSNSDDDAESGDEKKDDGEK